MKSLFGGSSSSSTTNTRRSKASSSSSSRPPPVSEHEEATRRRRSFAFLKQHSSNSSSTRQLRTSTQIKQSREHARQLAMAVSNDNFENDGNDFFASAFSSSSTPQASNQMNDGFDHSFEAAFGGGPSSTQVREPASSSQADRSFETGSAYDMDSFHVAPSSSPKRASRNGTTDGGWPSAMQPTYTMASSSQSQVPQAASSSYGRQSSQTSLNTSNSQHSASGGAAARRRMRNQFRSQRGGPGNSSFHDDASSVISETSSHNNSSFFSAGNPESPNGSLNRSMTSTGSTGARNRLSAYQTQSQGQQGQQQPRRMQSITSFSSNNDSSTNNSNSDTNLFDFDNDHAGFTFDAFGLDQSQVERDVDGAMRALQQDGMRGFSVFFANGEAEEFPDPSWNGDTPVTSRQSSPVPSVSENSNSATGGGFVDGFRVTQVSSPTRTSRDSPPSSISSSQHQQSSGVNRFKEQAGFGRQKQQQQQQNYRNSAPSPKWDDMDDGMNNPVNPWTQDPWDNDSDVGVGAKSETGGGANFASPSSRNWSSAKSDIGGGGVARNRVSWTNTHTAARTANKNNDDDDHSDGDVSQLQEDLAAEFAQDFVRKISPKHYSVQTNTSPARSQQLQQQHFHFDEDYSPRFEDPPPQSQQQHNYGQARSQFEQGSGSSPYRRQTSPQVSDVGSPLMGAQFTDGGESSQPQQAPPVSPAHQRYMQATNINAASATSTPPTRKWKRPSSSTAGNNPPKSPGSASASKWSTTSSSRPPASPGAPRAGYLNSSSDVGGDRAPSEYGAAASDYAVNSDVGVNSDVLVGGNHGMYHGDLNIPTEIPSSKKKDKTTKSKAAACTASHEEKKEEEATPRLSLKDKMKMFEQKSTPSSTPQQQAKPKVTTPTLNKANLASLQSSLGDEFLTPDIIEARRQEARKSRQDELRRSSVDASASAPLSPTKAPSPARQSGSQASSIPGQRESTSYSIGSSPENSGYRQQLRPSARQSMENAKPRSEGGAAVRNSAASQVIDRLRKASPRATNEDEAQSDVGENAAPAFLANVKLRKTGGGKKFFGSPEQEQEDEIPNQVPEQPQPQQQLYAQNASPERKLTYRERRELELQREQEEKDKAAAAAAQADAANDRDVASLIRKRIAMNKQQGHSATAPSFDEAKASSSPEHISNMRTMLKPVTSPGEEEVDQRHRSPSDSFSEQHSPRRSLASSQPAANQASPTVPPRHKSDRFHKFVLDKKNSVETGSIRSETPTTADTSRDGDSQDAVDEEPVAKNDVKNMLGGFLAGKVSVSSAPPAQPSVEEEPPSKNDVKNMLGGFLAGRLPGAAPVAQKPSKEDDEGALRRSRRQIEDRDNVTSDGLAASSSYEAPASPSSTHSSPRKSTANRPALKDDPKYERYFRMLKVGMPLDVVKHAMTKDGFDPTVMDGDHNKPAGLPLKDDPRYTKYFKMLKMGISKDQVKHAMERDGIAPEIMDQDPNEPVNLEIIKRKELKKEKDTHRRARLHWNTLQKVRSNSLWAKIEKDPEVSQIDIDEEEFANLFQANLTPSISPKGLGAQRQKGAAVRVIDPKRANNGGIILARLKMSHDEMADAVDRIDGEALTAEQIEHIIEYLPTKEERESLEEYMLEGDQDAAEKFDGLCECEKFMVSMMTVKHAKRKVRALLFRLQFMGCLESIAEDTDLIETSCDQLTNSARLRQLLGIVLQFGNRLNTAGSGNKRKAGAFTLDSLLKLSQAKAFDKKTTFLHYVVLIVQRNNENLLTFKDDLPTVATADKVYWDQCLTDLEEVENQLENVRRISLYQARSAQKFGLRETGGGDDNDSLGDVELSLEEEVEALRATHIGLFTLQAIKQVSALRDKVERTKRKFTRTIEYFGEDEQKWQPHELFNVIGKFVRDFEKAKEEVADKEKQRRRQESKNRGTPMKGKPPAAPPKPMMKSSSLQPNMSHVIKEMQSSSASHKPSNQYHKQPAPSNNSAPKPVSYSQPRSDDYPQQHSRVQEQRQGYPPQSSSQSSPSKPYVQDLQHQRYSAPPAPQMQQEEATPSPQSPSSAQDSIRQKARMRRQRQMQISTGRATPVTSNTSSSARPTPPPARSSSETSTYQSSAPAAPAPATSGSGGMSPKSALRHKRRMEVRKRMTTGSYR